MNARRWLPPVLWAALILVLTSIPAPLDTTVTVPYGDKLVHFLLYAGEGWLVARAMRTRRPVPLLTAVLVIAVFAALDEWHQRFFVRHPDMLDWVADVIGATVGIAAASRVRDAEVLS